jgi:hypothetical protein
MTRHGITVLLGVLCLAVALGWAQDRITEEDVVSALNGKPRSAAPGQPLGVALHVTVLPQTAAEGEGNAAMSDGIRQADEALYKTLIPLARAIEAEVLRGARFVIKLRPDNALPVEAAHLLGHQLAEKVEHFLSTSFAIPRERLSLQIAVPDSPAEGPGAPLHGPQRWRLAVFRQE